MGDRLDKHDPLTHAAMAYMASTAMRNVHVGVFKEMVKDDVMKAAFECRPLFVRSKESCTGTEDESTACLEAADATWRCLGERLVPAWHRRLQACLHRSSVERCDSLYDAMTDAMEPRWTAFVESLYDGIEDAERKALQKCGLPGNYSGETARNASRRCFLSTAYPREWREFASCVAGAPNDPDQLKCAEAARPLFRRYFTYATRYSVLEALH